MSVVYDVRLGDGSAMGGSLNVADDVGDVAGSLMSNDEARKDPSIRLPTRLDEIPVPAVREGNCPNDFGVCPSWEL